MRITVILDDAVAERLALEQRRRGCSFEEIIKTGEAYRRDDELHRQRLYKAADVAAELRQAGFRVRTMRRYGQFALPKAHAALVARKPE